MLANVSHKRRHNLLRRRVLPDERCNLRVLHKRLVGRDVGVVILRYKRFYRLANQRIHVLADGVCGLNVIRCRDEFVRVLDAQHLDHLPV